MSAEVIAQVTRWDVNAVPDDVERYPERHQFSITVERRGIDQWAVLNRLGECLGSDGVWDWEPQPSSRTDEWKDAHRFSMDRALDLAKEHAPAVRCMGMTPAQYVEWAVS